jgi:DNA-binding PadR family transcriptional regulator
MAMIYGPFRALSFSVLYPQLRKMLLAKLIEETFTSAGGLSRRSRIVYELTKAGREKLDSLMQSVSPDTFEDEGFEVRFAFFGPTPRNNRVKILEGRHR